MGFKRKILVRKTITRRVYIIAWRLNVGGPTKFPNIRRLQPIVSRPSEVPRGTMTNTALHSDIKLHSVKNSSEKIPLEIINKPHQPSH